MEMPPDTVLKQLRSILELLPMNCVRFGREHGSLCGDEVVQPREVDAADFTTLVAPDAQRCVNPRANLRLEMFEV